MLADLKGQSNIWRKTNFVLPCPCDLFHCVVLSHNKQQQEVVNNGPISPVLLLHMKAYKHKSHSDLSALTLHTYHYTCDNLHCMVQLTQVKQTTHNLAVEKQSVAVYRRCFMNHKNLLIRSLT